VTALGDFVQAHADRLIELDINPLFVHARDREPGQEHGVSVVDALIRMTD
jgi:hypothetical protein